MKKIHPLPRIPDPITATILKAGRRYTLEIPAAHADTPIQSMPGMTPRLLHGATVRLS